MSAKPRRFSAKIYSMGINRCVDVPENISRSFGKRGAVPVVIEVAGQTAQTTLVPRGNGCHRLFLDQRMRKAARADSGDSVTVRVRLDTKSREVAVPPELAAVLKVSKQEREVFNKTTPGLRREFLRWVAAAKTEETKLRRIRRGLQTLTERSRKRKTT